MRYMIVAWEEISTLDSERQAEVECAIGDSYSFSFTVDDEDYYEDRADEVIKQFLEMHPKKFHITAKKQDT